MLSWLSNYYTLFFSITYQKCNPNFQGGRSEWEVKPESGSGVESGRSLPECVELFIFTGKTRCVYNQ